MQAGSALATSATREHQRELLHLERDELERLSSIYHQARLEILDELSASKAETFTAQHYRVVLAQIETGLKVMRKKLGQRYVRLTQRLLDDSVRQTLAEIKVWEPKFRSGPNGKIRLQAVRQVMKQEPLLLHRYETSMARYGAELIGDIQRRLGVHLVKRSTWREMTMDVAGRLHTHAIAGARYKAARIVRTEMMHTTNVARQQSLEAAAEELPDLMRYADATLDNRTSDICKPPRMGGIGDTAVGLNEPWVWQGQDLWLTPFHPNCRTLIVGYRAAWADLLNEPPEPPTPVPPSATRVG